MRAGLRVLVASACLGVAGTSGAAAQSVDPQASGSQLQGCGPVCQFMQGRFGQAPAEPQQQPQSQTEIQPGVQETSEAGRPRRPRRNASRRAQNRQAAPEQASPAEEAGTERRSRTRASERTSAKAVGRKPGPAQSEVEQTASVAQASEIRFVSGVDEAHRALAGDLAGVVAPDVALRTIEGRGMPLRDVLSVPGADVTVTSSLTLARGSAYAEKVVYLAKLFPEELHAIAGAGIARLEDLDGKTVHLGPPDSDSEAAARTFLQSRGIAVTPVGGSFATALADLRAGRIAAAFILAPKPFAPLAGLRSVEGLHLLPLPYRASDGTFYPAALSAADYPGLLAADERLETVALDAILVAPRWKENTPRQRELSAFTTRVFERLGAPGGEVRNPKWKDTNLAAAVEGFRRLKAAQQWVAARLKGRDVEAGAGSRDRRVAGEAP